MSTKRWKKRRSVVERSSPDCVVDSDNQARETKYELRVLLCPFVTKTENVLLLLESTVTFLGEEIEQVI